MSRSLDSLSDRFRPLAQALLEQAKKAGLDILVVYTKRTEKEQAAVKAAGKSWTNHSKHLTGDALDFAILHDGKIDWDDIPSYERVGLMAEALGLRWGGRWKQRDWGHVEWQDANK